MRSRAEHRECSSRRRQGPLVLQQLQAQPLEAEAPGSGTWIALGTVLDAVPEALVRGLTLWASGGDLVLVMALRAVKKVRHFMKPSVSRL
jgi:hypothetical protein